jgi:hypothetical protein
MSVSDAVLLRPARAGALSRGRGRQVGQPFAQARSREVGHVQLAQTGQHVGVECIAGVAGVLAACSKIRQVVFDGLANRQPARRSLPLLGERGRLGPGGVEVIDADAVSRSRVVGEPELFNRLRAVDPPAQQPAANLLARSPLPAQVSFPRDQRHPVLLPPELEPGARRGRPQPGLPHRPRHASSLSTEYRLNMEPARVASSSYSKSENRRRTVAWVSSSLLVVFKYRLG